MTSMRLSSTSIGEWERKILEDRYDGFQVFSLRNHSLDQCSRCGNPYTYSMIEISPVFWNSRGNACSAKRILSGMIMPVTNFKSLHQKNSTTQKNKRFFFAINAQKLFPN